MEKKNIVYLSGLNLTSILRNLYGIVRAKATTMFLGIFGVGILGQISTFFSVQNRLVTFGIEAFLINRIPKIDEQKTSRELISIVYQSILLLILMGNFAAADPSAYESLQAWRGWMEAEASAVRVRKRLGSSV